MVQYPLESWKEKTLLKRVRIVAYPFVICVFPFWQWFTVGVYSIYECYREAKSGSVHSFFCCNHLASLRAMHEAKQLLQQCWSMMILLERFHSSCMLRMTTTHCYRRILSFFCYLFFVALVILFFFLGIFDHHTCKLHNLFMKLISSTCCMGIYFWIKEMEKYG